jgi:hypothetical protein
MDKVVKLGSSEVQQVAVDLVELLHQKDVPLTVGLAGLAMALVSSAGATDEPYDPDTKVHFMNAISSTWDEMREWQVNVPTIN